MPVFVFFVGRALRHVLALAGLVFGTAAALVLAVSSAEEVEESRLGS